MHDAEDVLELLNSHVQELKPDHLVEIREKKKAALKEQSDLSLNLRRGP